MGGQYYKWNAARYERKLSEMRAKEICPDCSGRGINTMALYEFLYTDYDCPGCSGSGLFSDWYESK
jgi:DnaJ-class molecular chaperone